MTPLTLKFNWNTEHHYIKLDTPHQGCALAEPGCPWQLTVAFGRPGNKFYWFLHQTYVVGALDLMALEVTGSQLLYLSARELLIVTL